MLVTKLLSVSDYTKGAAGILEVAKDEQDPPRWVLSLKDKKLELFVTEPAAKGRLYPTYFRKDEDYQFPLPGQEHVFYAVHGHFDFYEKNTMQEFTLNEGQTLWIRRPELKEYLNVRGVGRSETADLIFGVIHLPGAKPARARGRTS